ncbi:hypothetical protein [Motilibacter aurantiacus]|uniref:hypothetical protein n=1 Tax=Motilibacter aurantiacus TaxID=2714955 RepID=UPI001409795F|nr:hypothetical protein [Motilibacter aurantiacus]NHC43848.1 hypothetical protein [Motilibacter aurantiacus]
MRALLVLGGPRLARDPLLQQLRALAGAGWQADVVSFRALDDEVRAAVHATGGEIVLLLPTGLRPTVPALAPRSRRLARALRGVERRAEPYRAKMLGRMPGWAYARRLLRDIDAVRVARAADVAVAVDRDSGLAVWKLARRRPDLTAVNGLGALANLMTRYAGR